MKWGEDWGPGWRYFACGDCDNIFKESCRDATTRSISTCPTCCDIVSPFKYEIDLTMPVDNSKNLLKVQLIMIKESENG